MNKKRYIAFVGDSFCASIKTDHYDSNGRHRRQIAITDPYRAAFPSVVADHYDLNLLAHGYSGKSWWYSRSQFSKQLAKNLKIRDKLDAIVFCHTDANRINSNNLYACTINRPGLTRTNYANDEDQQVAQAQLHWHKHLLDMDFQSWAQLNWFREISREWADIKQVHFHCFKGSASHDHLLIGQRFSDPLLNISIAELTGTSADIDEYLLNDNRANHLSDANNRVLANITIDALDNYEHKVRPLDMSMFTGMINPNYANFPRGKYGTS